jgi:hypothetical protein
MKAKLLFWIDKLIYTLEDTMPDKKYDTECFKQQKSQIKELKSIRKWVNNILKTID